MTFFIFQNVWNSVNFNKYSYLKYHRKISLLPKLANFTILAHSLHHFCVVTKLLLPNCWLPIVTVRGLPNFRYQNVGSQIVSYQISVTKNPPVVDSWRLFVRRRIHRQPPCVRQGWFRWRASRRMHRPPPCVRQGWFRWRASRRMHRPLQDFENGFWSKGASLFDVFQSFL